MTKFKEISIDNRTQYLYFLYLSVFVSLITLVLYFFDTSSFQRFLGTIHPLLVLSISITLGFSTLKYLDRIGEFAIYKKKSLIDYLIVSAVALAFGIEVIFADIWLLDYSADINIHFPESILFYPAIGFIVEVFFHLLPITFLTIALSAFRRLELKQLVWISIIVVAIAEPIYQVWFTSQNSLITSIYTGIHVFLFSLAQLVIFKRFDFISMYLFRIVFYSVWHILWGHIRLDFLFNL